MKLADFWKRKLPGEAIRAAGDGVPGELFFQCPRCKRMEDRQKFSDNLYVCPFCGHHIPLSAHRRLYTVVDEESFQELDPTVRSGDPLRFKDQKGYRHRLRDATQKTDLREAVVTGRAEIESVPVFIGVMDFRFLGGSLGSGVGEKLYRLAVRARKERCPLVLFCASGGARMQEGLIALLQMAKVSLAISRLKSSSLYVTVLTHPTTGGVAASFAAQADVMIGEKGSLVGFAGPRVIQQTIGEELPLGFQRAEALLEDGLLDMVLERKEIRPTLGKLLRVAARAT